MYCSVLLLIFPLFVNCNPCGEIFSSPKFTLTSPNHPQPSCFFLLKGTNCTTHFKIDFANFTLKSSLGCVEERLEVGKQDALCGVKSGSRLYKSENGDLQLKVEGEGKFKLMVSRIDECEEEDMETTTIIPSVTNRVYLPPPTPQCCQSSYSSKTFLLTSPSFPQSSTNDCIYIIKKSNPLVCRLRINVLFFNVGIHDQKCPEGFLEIDGKKICGCLEGLKLTTNFNEGDNKVIRYKGGGGEGFVVEVIQDECQKIYSKYKRSVVDQLRLVHEKSLDLQGVQKHFYFFAPEDEQPSWTGNLDTEETDSFDVSSFDPNPTNRLKCLQWNYNQLSILESRFGNSLQKMCKSVQNINSCILLGETSGMVSTPRYPSTYPSNQRICYRFQLKPNYCAVQLQFGDFQLERSYDCLKDYLIINKSRYCGVYLANKQVLITPISTHEDINFISDSSICGRGFSARYKQVSCTNSNSYLPPDNCQDELCQKTIQDRYFTIRDDYSKKPCRYLIKKISEDVCTFHLYFEVFHIPCEFGYIMLDGRSFCGERSGQSYMVNAQMGELTVLYQPNTQVNFLNKFVIRGKQVDCDRYLIPQPAKVVLAGPDYTNSDRRNVSLTSFEDSYIV